MTFLKTQFARLARCLCVSVVILAFAAQAHASAAHVYITQNGAGAKDGSSLANAGACDATPNTPQATCAFFNNTANWGSGSTQIGAGTIVHLNGTITAAVNASGYLTFMGSGAAGNPVTLLFDTDAVVTSPAFAVGINIASQSYIAVDGGSNGILQNTANGTVKANHRSSQGIHVSGAYYIEIKNLTIKDIYNNTGSTSGAVDVAGAGTQNIRVDGANGSLNIHHNTLSAARTGVDLAFTTSLTYVNVYANTVSDHCWGIRLSEESAGSTSSNLQIYGNTITDWTNWQWPTATYHTDGIITYGQQNSTLAVNIFNNYIYGNLGAGSPTAFIFCTYGNASPGATCNLFNNLLVASGGSYPVWIKDGRTTNQVYNNTIIGGTTASGKAITLETSTTQATIKNNIVVNFQRFVKSYNAASTQVTSDRNVVVAGASPIEYNDGAAYYTWAQWQGLGKDANSSTANPSLDANYKIPGTGSSAYRRGENLRSLNLDALNRDRDSNERDATGTNWDAGAYEYGASVPPDPNAINVIQVKTCGPQTFDPTTGGKCAITATSAGSMIVVAYGSYNSAGTTPVINSITDNGGSSTYQQATGARAVNTAGGQTSWNDMWYAANVASGITELTIKTSTSQTGDVFIWEVSNVNTLDVAGHLDSQASTTTPVSPSLTTTAAKTFIAALAHPQPGHAPTGIHSGNVFTSDAVNDGMGAAHYTASSAGGYQAEWDLGTAGVYASLAAAFKWQQGLAAAAPTFLPAAGTYTSAQNVAISSATGGATICFTSDGSEPTADGNGACTHGITYTAAVVVASSATVKAIASAAGYSDSAVASAAYTIRPVSVGMTLRGASIKGVVVK